MFTKTNQYDSLTSWYRRVHRNKNKRQIQAEVNDLWHSLKQSKTGPVDQEKYRLEIERLKSHVRKLEGCQTSISSFLKRKPDPPPPRLDENYNENEGEQRDGSDPTVVGKTISTREEAGSSNITRRGEEDAEEDNAAGTGGSNQENVETEVDAEYQTPKQDKLKREIMEKEAALGKLIDAKLLGLESETTEKINKRIGGLRQEVVAKKKELKIKEDNQKAVQKLRAKKRKAEEALLRENPEVAKSLKIRDGVGRPRVEVDQPGLLHDILKIATIGAACGDKRRDDIFRTVKTLDDLKSAIDALGYTVSRQALYLRLLPRDAKSLHGQKHVKAVNVKLVRPSNDLRKKHPDRIFARESCRGVDEIVTYFGPEASVFLGQDDKSSVPLGVPCAKKQSSILMNMRVRVRLPDHDFKVGKRHLLTPSVLAVCGITQEGVTYTGPTYVAIRSSKHNGSTTYSHNVEI